MDPLLSAEVLDPSRIQPENKMKKAQAGGAQTFFQCCGSGSGVRCLFDPWCRDPGSGMGKKSRSGSGMGNIPDHIFESLETIFWIKILKFFDCGSGFGIGNLLEPRSGDPG
jgi:hypothetical protein